MNYKFKNPHMESKLKKPEVNFNLKKGDQKWKIQ
jgi:hypothetical protein